jgi:tetratricopeptide (TPR) repeat protein
MPLVRIGLKVYLMKHTLILAAFFVICGTTAFSQAVPPGVSPSPAKLSAILAEKLSQVDRDKEVSREDREQAYRKLLEGQRNLWRMRYQRTQAGRMLFAEQARTALITSLDVDPTLSEPYVALTELSLMISPNDIEEAAALSSIAVRLNKDSIGGHKFYARLLTRQSKARGPSPDIALIAKAIDEWKEVTRLDPRNAEAWSMLSELYEKTGKTSDSIEALQKWVASTSTVDSGWYRQIVGGQAEDIAPENAAPRLSSALIAAGRHQEAIAVLTQILSDDPDNQEVFGQIERAIQSADRKLAPSLIDSVKQIVDANPGNVTLLISFAGLQAKAGNTEQAVRTLAARYDKLRATDRAAAANIQVSIGDILAANGKFVEAVAAYEASLAARGLDTARNLDPDEREFATAVFEKIVTSYKRAARIEDAKAAIARARKLLGNEAMFADKLLISLYRDTGNRADALAVLRAARAKDPEDVSMLRLEAMILVEAGQVDKGVELIKQRIESGKKETPVQRFGTAPAMPRMDDEFSNYIYIAQLYNDAGRGTDSVSAADQAYSVAGSEDRRQIARLMKATGLQTAGQFDQAETILREIIKVSPRNPIALNNLGYFLLERDQRFPEAIELIRQAVEIDPTNPSYLDSLGWAHFKLGRIDDAIKYLEDAAKYDDTSATIQEHLGDVYRRKGLLELARASWQRALTLSSGTSDIARVKEKLASAK